jgi:ketosteroid isomerase-like protein
MTMTRHTRQLFAVVGLQVLCACTININGARDDESVELIERRRFSAMVAQDVGTLAPMLADDLVYTHSTGEVETKAQFLETVRTARLRYESIDVKTLDVRRYDDVAVLTGRAAARVQVGGRSMELDVRFTDAYVNRDGHWQLVAWQSTRVQ